MEETNTQIRTKFRFVKEKDLAAGNKHKEIGLFSISEKSLSIGIGGDSYIYLPSIETLNEDFVSKISYTRDMINKADIEMIYTKDQVDEKIAQAVSAGVVDLSDYYTKSETYSQTEVDDKLLLKADINLVYTKDEVDDLIGLIPTFDSSLYYNKTEVDDKIDLKLDTSVYNNDKLNYVLKTDMVDYYLKKDIDSKLDEKVNVVDYEADKLTFATKDELNLKLDASIYNSDKTSFATKLELSDKADDSKIGDLQNTGLTGTTVTELLTDTKNRIDSISSGGSVDLSNYYTKSETYKKDEIDLKLSDKLNNNALDNYYNKSYIDSDIATKAELADKVSNSSLTQDYYNKSDIDSKLSNKLDNTALDNYYDNSEVYTKLEVDGKVDEKVAKLDYESDKLSFATKLELADKADDSIVTELSNKLGDLQNTGLTGTTVTELLTDVKSRIDGVQAGGGQVDLSNYYDKSQTYSKAEVDDQLLLKADITTVNGLDTRIGSLEGSIANKVEDSEYQTTKNKALANESNISDINSKLGDLQNTGLTGSTVTELLTDAKTKIDNIDLSNFYTKNDTYTKSEVDDLIDLIPVFNDSDYYNKTTMDGLLADKADKTSLDDYYNKSFVDTNIATKAELTNKANTSDLTNYYTKDEANGLLSNKLDNNALDNYYTKSETYKKDEIDGKVGDKLDTSIYNSDKLAYALKTDLSDINVKLEKLNNSIRPVLSLTEDTAAVEGQLDKQTWLTQKLKTEKQLDPENGLVITTSDGDSYFYFDGQWTLKKTYKVSHVTDTVMGIVQSKSDKGYGYIKASPSNDGTMVLTDYQDILDAIDLKADDSDLTTLSGKVSTLEGTVSQKADSSSIGNLTISGLSGSNVTELLASAKGELDLKASKLEVSGIDGRVGTLEGEIANKLNSSALNDYYNKSHIDTTFATKSELTQNYYNSTTIDSKLDAKLDDTALDSYYDASHIDSNFATKSDLSNKVDNNTLTQDYYNKSDVDQKITQAVTGGKVDLTNYYTKGETYSQLEADSKFALITDLNNKADDSKIGDLQSTGLTGTNVTELLTDANTKIANINISNYYTKREVDDSLNLKLNASEITNYYPKTETYSQVQADGKFALISVVNTKADQSSIGDLTGTGLTGSTVTELLTDVKNKIDGIGIGNYYTKLEADSKFALTTDLDDKADDSKVGTLAGTGLTGSTVTELLTDAKTKIDDINIGNYYDKSYIDSDIATKAELADKVSSGTFNTLEGKVTTLEGTVSTKADDSKIGNLLSTGFVGSTVTELLTDAKTKIDNISIGNYYNKREVDDKLDLKLDTSEISKYYPKTETYSQLEADGKFATKLEVGTKADDSKVGDLQNTGLTGTTVTELLTNAKTKIDLKASQSDVVSLTGRVGTLEGEIANKLNSSALDDYYNETTIDGLLANKANQSSIGNLQGTGLTGTTVTELLTDAKTRIDGINIGNYYNKSETYTKGEVDGKLSAKLNSADASSTYATKSELADKADSSLLDDKLDASTYNSEKSGFATTRSVEQLNEKLEKFNNSIRPVLMLSEDTSTVESQYDTQAWLTQKLKTEKQLDPENGLVITTSDGDSYFYFETQWVLRKTYKVGSVTNSTSGIVLGKDEVGHGYIKASDALDGTMVLVDYQDIVDSIRTKAEGSAVTTLEGRVGTVEGQLSNKVNNDTLTSYYTSSTVDSLLSAKLDSSTASTTYATKGEVSVKANQSSIGDLTGTGLTGTTVTELLTDAKTKIDDINIGNYYPKNETYSQTEISGLLSSKADTSNVLLNNTDQTINGLLTSTSGFKVEKANPYIQLRDTTGNKTITMSTIDNGTNLEFDINSGSGSVQFVGTLKYKWSTRPTVSDDNDIPSYKQIKDEFATVTSLNSKANDNAVVKLTGNQTISGNKTFNNDVMVNGVLKAGTRLYFANNVPSIAPLTNEAGTIYMANGLIGANCYYNLQFENKGKIFGLKDGTADSDAANIRNIKNYALPKTTTDAINSIQVTNSAQKYFNFDYVYPNSAYRNYSGLKLRTKRDNENSFTDMWSISYRGDNSEGIFMNCVGNKLSFENTSKIINISCEDSDSDSTAVSKIFLTNKLSALTGTYMNLTGDQDIGGVKNFTGTILSASSDGTYGSNRYYADNDSNGLGQPVFNTFGTKTEKQATVGFADASEQGKFEIKIENLPSRPNPKISLGNNTEIDGTLNVTGQITAPNMPVVLPAGTTPDTTNIPAMKVAYILK